MRLIRSAVAGAGILVAILASAAPAALAAQSAGSAVSPAAAEPATNATPDPAHPGESVEFTIDCGLSAGSAILFGTTLGLAGHISMTDQSADNPGTWAADVTLPSSILAGSYGPEMDCDNGVSANALITVTAAGALPAAGGAATGDGTTSTATDSALTVTGLALLGLGSVAGGFAIRRRRSGPGARG